MKIIGCQWDIAWEDREANFSQVRDLLEPVETADLIILPEMFSTGFSMNTAAILEKEGGEAECFVREVAVSKKCVALGGITTKGNGEKGQNELVAFDASGSLLTRYQKNRTFRFTGESDYFENGNEDSVFDLCGTRIASLICYDLRFPELFRRSTAMGAEVFVVIASWPDVRVDHWVTLLRARAIENLAYVIGVNRTGSDPNSDYPGRSIVVDPLGEIVADAGSVDGLLEADLDMEKLREWRAKFPALKDLEF